MHAFAAEKSAEIFQQQNPVGDRLAVIAAQMELAQGGGGGVAHLALTGRLPLQRQVMHYRETVIAMNDEIDFNTGAKPHRLDDEPSGEDRIGNTATAAMPLDGGAMAIAVKMDGCAHGQLRKICWLLR
ncbi:hypothetical protein D3C80_1072290 [compost metagenome]